jgi:hypothetical protein
MIFTQDWNMSIKKTKYIILKYLYFLPKLFFLYLDLERIKIYSVDNHEYWLKFTMLVTNILF